MGGRRRAGAVTRVGLSALVVLSALFGPVYLREALTSVVHGTVGRATVPETSLTLRSSASSPDTLADLVPAEVGRWFGAPVLQSGVGVAVWPQGTTATSGHVVWRDDACRHVVLRAGRCPGSAGEVLVEASLADTLGWRPGTAVRVSEFSGGTAFPDALPVVPLEVVGLYTQREDPAFWFGERLGTAADAGPLDSTMGTLLTDRATLSMTGPTRSGAEATWSETDSRVDLALRPDAVGLDEVLTAGPLVAAFVDDPTGFAGEGVVAGSGRWATASSGLPALADEVVVGRRQSLVTVPLLAGALTALVAAVFWVAVRAAAQDRRPQAALTRLRGQGPGGVRRLLLADLLPGVLVGVPLGVLATAALAWLAARAWFDPPADPGVDAAVLGVAALAVLLPPALTWLAARQVAREPAAALLRAVPARVGRRPVAAVEAVVATLAVAGFVGVVQGSVVGSTALAAPLLLALAGGLAAARLTTPLLTRLGATRYARGSLVGGLALTRAGRRGLARWVVPTLATAVALLVFAASAVTDAGRAYRLQSLVDLGAPVVLDVATVPPSTLAAAVEAADPGHRSTPVVLATPGDRRAVTTLAVDTTRVRGIAQLPDGIPADAWSRLAPSPVPPLVLTGRRLTLVAESDGLLGTPDSDGSTPSVQPVTVSLDYLRPDGAPASTTLATLTGRPRRVPVAVTVPCDRGCRLVGVTLDVPTSGTAGRVALLDPALDDRPTDLGPPSEWLPLAVPATVVTASVVPPPAGSRGIVVDADLGQESRVEVHQASVPYAFPALATPGTASATGVRSGTLAGGSRPMATVATVDYVPGAGPLAVLVDLRTIAAAGWAPGPGITSHVLVADDDPALVASVRRGLASQGVEVLGERHASEGAAAYGRSAAGWSLRLGAVLAVLAILAAGATVAAVVGAGATGARREYASLRLLGGTRRDVVRVTLGELLPLVVVGVVVGAVCGHLAAAVTVARLPLYVRPPAVDVAHRAAALGDSVLAGGVALVVLALLAGTLARWVARRTAPEILEEAR